MVKSIEFAIESFKAEYQKKKFQKRIFLITDGESSCDPRYINYVAQLINENDVRLNVITVGFFNELDMEEGEVAEDNTSSANQINTKEVLMKLQETCSEQVKVFSATQASMIQNQFRKKKINPVTKYRGPLRITPNLSLDVMLYVKSTIVNIPSLKKYSLASEFQPDVKANMIENEKIFYLHDDPEQHPISDDKRMKAYYYGKSLVPFGTEDDEAFKCLEEKCLKVIGFTDSYKVPRKYQ